MSYFPHPQSIYKICNILMPTSMTGVEVNWEFKWKIVIQYFMIVCAFFMQIDSPCIWCSMWVFHIVLLVNWRIEKPTILPPCRIRITDNNYRRTMQVLIITKTLGSFIQCPICSGYRFFFICWQYYKRPSISPLHPAFLLQASALPQALITLLSMVIGYAPMHIISLVNLFPFPLIPVLRYVCLFHASMPGDLFCLSLY